MRSKDSDAIIGRALQSLFAQDEQGFELIVADSGSRDGTLDILARHPLRLIQIEPEDYQPGAVLNRVVKESRGEILVFQNADVVLRDSRTLGRLIEPFLDPDVQATFARQVPRPHALAWVKSDYARAFPETRPPWMMFSLAFAGMRRSIWQERPFYEWAWASEDTEWGRWARSDGRTIVYVPEAVVEHSHNYSLTEIYGRRFVEGEADAYIARGRGRIANPILDFAKFVYRDVVWHIRKRDPSGALLLPVRRLVYAWAWYRGHRHGEKRIARGDEDAGFGSRTVLERRGREG